jgi:hypothetical protein
MKYAAIPVLFLLTMPAWAMKIQDSRGSVYLELPANWKYEKNLLGLPHVFLSPEDKDRVSVSLTLTGIEDVKLPVKELHKNQNQYQEGRKEWAEERGFSISNFTPYETSKTKDKFQIHEIGFEYKDAESTYRELSWYVECPESLLHLKLLGTKTSARFEEGKAIIKSLSCRN